MKKILLILALIFMTVLPVFGQTGNYTVNEYFYLPLYGAYGLTEYNEYNRCMQIADYQIELNKTAGGDENIQDVAGGMWTGNTETFIDLVYQDTDGTTDAVVPVKDEDNMVSDSATFLCTQQSIKAYADTLHALQYLKTEIDTQGEVETIWGVTLSTDAERNALTYSDVGAIQDAANTIDSDKYVDASIDHEHLAPDVISGLTDVTSEDTDYILVWDSTDSALKKVDMGEVRGGNGGATTFVELTDTPANYTGSANKFLQVNATPDALIFDTISSDDLSDVDSIAMLDEAETVTGGWTFDEILWVKREVDAPTSAPMIELSRRRDGDPTYTLESGDYLGILDFSGETGGIYLTTAAEIRAIVEGEVSEDTLHARLEFLTTTLRMAIDSTGNIKMGDGAWTNYVNVDNAGTLTFEGTASMTPKYTVTTISSAHTMTVAEAGTVLVSCAATPYTIGLPTAVGNLGLTYHFVKTDANYFLITLDCDGTETLNYENSTSAPCLTYPRLNTFCAEVTIVSDNTNWQVIDEALGQVPECRVYLAAHQENIADQTWTLKAYDTETYDIGSNFNTTTHKFIVPVPGRYSLYVINNWAEVVADKSWAIDIKIGEVSQGSSWAHSAVVGTIGNVYADILSCAISDEITIKVRHTAGVNTPDLEENDPLIIRLISKD